MRFLDKSLFRFLSKVGIQNTKTSINEKIKVNSLLQIIVSGQAGVVLEE